MKTYRMESIKANIEIYHIDIDECPTLMLRIDVKCDDGETYSLHENLDEIGDALSSDSYLDTAEQEFFSDDEDECEAERAEFVNIVYSYIEEFWCDEWIRADWSSSCDFIYKPHEIEIDNKTYNLEASGWTFVNEKLVKKYEVTCTYEDEDGIEQTVECDDLTVTRYDFECSDDEEDCLYTCLCALYEDNAVSEAA